MTKKLADMPRNMKNVLIKLYYSLIGFKSLPRLFSIWIQVRMNNVVIVMGDSHTCFFEGEKDFDIARKNSVRSFGNMNVPHNYPFEKYFVIFHIGAALAYNAGKKKSTTDTYRKSRFVFRHFVREGGVVVCSFGEIDICCHVFKQTKITGRTYQAVIDEIIDRYLLFLLDLKRQKVGVRIYVWGPIASVSDRNNHIGAIGSEIDRNIATRYFNEELKVGCEKIGVMYMSLYDKLIDANGRTIEEYYSSDGEHLSSNAFFIAKQVIDEQEYLRWPVS